MQHRHTFLLVLIGLWSAALVVRLLNLQVSRYDHYVAIAERQQRRVLVIPSLRGAIQDSRGRELALSISVSSLYAVPSEIEDPQSTAKALAGLLDLTEKELLHQLSSEREFAWLARRLDPPVAGAVQRLKIPGLYFVSESKRYYPQRELAAQVLGYVGTDNHGLAGLELLYDQILYGGKAVSITLLRTVNQRTAFDPLTPIAGIAPKPGQDLRLTLDAVVQYLVEQELYQAFKKKPSLVRASSVVLDPRSGAVLAMATIPGFDPNQFDSYPPANWRNRPIADNFEPGPAFSLLSGLTPSEGEARTSLLEDSGNQNSAERLFTQLGTLGFGRPTGMDLPGESPGILPPLRKWGSSSAIEVAQGRGVAVTQLQLAAAFAAVANGGFLYQPYVVAKPGETQPKPVALPFSRETCTRLIQKLERIVLGGNGPAPSFSVHAALGRGGVSPSPSNMKWYVAFAPVRTPRLLCLVVLHESGTHTQISSSELEGRALVHSILSKLLRYYRLPPDPVPPLEFRPSEDPTSDPVQPQR